MCLKSKSAASASVEVIAPGENLSAGQPPEIFGPLPTSLRGTGVAILDSAGKSWTAPLLYASPQKVTVQVPSGVATGLAQVNVSYAGATALFTINGAGL